MSGIMKVFLLLAVAVCISKAQLNEPGQSCLCQRVRNGVFSKSDIRDIQIYPATIFCDKVEIVVTSANGRYCLNPELQIVKKMLTRVLRRKAASTSKPTSLSSSSVGSSSTTAQI